MESAEHGTAAARGIFPKLDLPLPTFAAESVGLILLSIPAFRGIYQIRWCLLWHTERLRVPFTFMENLLTEIHDAQRARQDLLKWKLLVVSVLGGYGLGFSGESRNENAPLVLGLIPFASVYIDLLCRNLSIRSKSIAHFLAAEAERADSMLEARYARFYYQHVSKKRGPALESLALIWSTVFLCAGTLASGTLLASSWGQQAFIAGSGLVGIALALRVEKQYQAQKQAIAE